MENQTTLSPLIVHELFRSLLAETNPSNSSVISPQRLSNSITPRPLASPPHKNTIRYIENDPTHSREKYDGHRWRLVCTWNIQECTNIAGSHRLCNKHNSLRRNNGILVKKKKKPLSHQLSMPIIQNYNYMNTNSGRSHNNDNDDDDIQIIGEFNKNTNICHSLNSNMKKEMLDLNVFSVENFNDTDIIKPIKSEPMICSNTRSSMNDEIQYVSSKARPNGLNVDDLLSKNIPPLTEFEEDYIADNLISKLPRNCLMLDAQLYLHNEVMTVVKKNYRQKMSTIAPEYFYDFLLRHPRVPLHFKHWFQRCKPIPPTTGCSIDLKLWTLSMTVRGATADFDLIDENMS